MYNTVKELHIALDEALDYLASNRNRILKPHEKDFLLNETMFRVIDDIIDGKKVEGYDDTQLSYDALQPLKTRLNLRPNYDYARNRIGVVLPANYKHLDSVEYETWVDCNNRSLDSDTIPMFVLNFGDGGTAPYYQDLKIRQVFYGNNIVLYDAAARGYTAFNRKESKFMLIADILSVLREQGFDAHWEQSGDEYYPNSIIIQYHQPYQISTSFVIEYTGVNNASQRIDIPYYILNATVENIVKVKAEHRLISTSELRKALNSKYNTTHYESVLTTIEENKLYGYYNNEFIIQNLELVYIRKPRLINYITDTMPEIVGILDLIVQETAQNIKAKLKDENYQFIVNENNLTKNI